MFIHTLISVSLILAAQPAALRLQNTAEFESTPKETCELSTKVQIRPKDVRAIIIFINRSSDELHALYVWDNHQRPEKDDMLGSCTLSPGEKVALGLTAKQLKACTFQFVGVFTEAASVTGVVNVCRSNIATVEFFEQPALAPELITT